MFRIAAGSLLFVFLCAAPVYAQTESPSSSSFSSSAPAERLLPEAPSALPPAPPAHPAYVHSGYSGYLGGHVACGGGLRLPAGSTQNAPLTLCGVGFTVFPYTAFELGGVRLQDGSAHVYIGEDFIAPITPVFKHLRGEPIGIIGYTKIVGDSNRLDYGVGWEHHIGPQQSLGLEVRDYVQFSTPVQHAVVLRLSLLGGVPDDWD